MNQAVANTVVEAVKLTREEKLTAKIAACKARLERDTVALVDLELELSSIAALAAIDVGSVVVVKLGRKFSEEKDTTRYELGTVIGVKEEEESKLYKVTYGVGFDANVVVVTGAALSLPTAGGEPEVEAAPSAE